MGCVRCELSTPYSILIPVGISGGESFEVRELAELDPFFQDPAGSRKSGDSGGVFQRRRSVHTTRARGKEKKNTKETASWEERCARVPAKAIDRHILQPKGGFEWGLEGPEPLEPHH